MTTQIKFFVYLRKSTDDKKEKRQVLSLDAQLRELRDVISREHLSIVATIEEKRSAKEPGRPLFNRMLDRIERGEANGIIIWDIDRLYRNPVDEGRVRWMLQQGIIACVKTPTRSYFPPDAGLLMAIEGGRSSDFIIHHKRNVARGVHEKLLRGQWAGQKPIGYIYDHDLRNIVPHPKQSKIVQAIFKEASTGRYGLTALGDRLAQFGVVTKKQKKPWSNSQIHKLLTNRLYCGIMDWNGETFEGKYKPIVSLELFDQVQAALKDRSKPRLTKKSHNFPFCGLFHCTCGAMISAQLAKGHGGLYRYYRCTRKFGNCAEPYTQEKFVIQQCLDILKPLALSTDEANHVRRLIDEETEKDGGAIEEAVEQINDKLSAVQGKLNKLTRGYLDERIEEESYQSATADLIAEKTRLKQEKKRIESKGSSYWNEPAKEVINAMELAGKMQIEKSPQEISQLVHKFGTNRLLTRKTVSFSFSELYDFPASLLASRQVSTLNNSSSLCDANFQNTRWCAMEGLNLRPLQCQCSALPLS
jgi:site-specific DNA recombinase